MNKSEFSSALSNPEYIENIPTEDIRSLVNLYPFCQPAQIMLAKKLRDKEDIGFESQLNLTAAYTSSRKTLYNLLNKPVSVREKVETISQPVQEIVTQESVKDEIDELITRETSLYRLEEIPVSVESALTFEEPPVHEGPNVIDPGARHAFGEWLGLFDENAVNTVKEEQKIIEDFIKSDFHAVQHKHHSPDHLENLARRSAEDKFDDIVTETLARIFLDQGNKMKAIEIYERLKLKYPEKSSYFAAQIDFLKSK